MAENRNLEEIEKELRVPFPSEKLMGILR